MIELLEQQKKLTVNQWKLILPPMWPICSISSISF